MGEDVSFPSLTSLLATTAYVDLFQMLNVSLQQIITACLQFNPPLQYVHAALHAI